MFCGSQTEIFYSQAAAQIRWNTRAAPAATISGEDSLRVTCEQMHDALLSAKHFMQRDKFPSIELDEAKIFLRVCKAFEVAESLFPWAAHQNKGADNLQ
jgi:hypothetical protein